MAAAPAEEAGVAACFPYRIMYKNGPMNSEERACNEYVTVLVLPVVYWCVVKLYTGLYTIKSARCGLLYCSPGIPQLLLFA